MPRARVWDFLLKLVLSSFIPVGLAIGGGLVVMARQISVNQTVISANQKAIEASSVRIQTLETIARVGPRFTPEMNETADFRLKEWSRDRFVTNAALGKIDAKLDSVLRRQDSIKETMTEMTTKIELFHGPNGSGN